MTKPTVYMETSVVSYLAARPSGDLVIAARQLITHEWWNDHRPDFDVAISAFVVNEASRGDAEAASKRMAYLAGLAIFEPSGASEEIAAALIAKRLIPLKYAEDAAHIAVAAQHGADYLLTWNFRHINNAITRTLIKTEIEGMGFSCPVICSPEELIGENK